MQSDKYAANRALNALEQKRESENWTGDTGLYPIVIPIKTVATVPAIPLFLRKQAD